MALTRKTLVVGAVTVLEAGCLIGVASLGRGLLPPEPASAGSPVAASEIAGLASEDLQPALETALERAAIPGIDADDEGPPARRAERPPRTESEFYAAFAAIAADGPAALERAVRDALAGDGPDSRKVAALRVLADAGSPAADEACVRAILDLPDVPAGEGDSVPRFALRCLAERAESDPAARRALEILAFERPSLASPLRAAAAVALFSAVDEAELDRIADRLRAEPDERVREDATRALRASLGIGESSVDDAGGRDG